MNKKRVISMAWLFLAAFSTSVLGATYSYSGGNYSAVSGAYTTAMNATGQFTTAAPLPANMGQTDISGQVVSFSFNDGLQTFTQADATPISFLVATDGTGAISTWAITVWSSPVPTTVGADVAGMDISFDGTTTQDAGFQDASCLATDGPGGPCTNVDISAGTQWGMLFATSAPAPGAWNCTDCIAAIPVLSGAGLLAALLTLSIAGALTARRRRS